MSDMGFTAHQHKKERAISRRPTFGTVEPELAFNFNDRFRCATGRHKFFFFFFFFCFFVFF